MYEPPNITSMFDMQFIEYFLMCINNYVVFNIHERPSVHVPCIEEGQHIFLLRESRMILHVHVRCTTWKKREACSWHWGNIRVVVKYKIGSYTVEKIACVIHVSCV